MHIYVDESKSKAYIFAAVIIEPGRAAALRKLMRNFLMPGQGHIHFVNESDSRRRRILQSLEDIEVRVRIYRVTGLNPIVARTLCLGALMDDCLILGATALTLERDDSLFKSDEIVLRQGLYARGLKKNLEYLHVGKSDEPIVWIADAIAWSYARGGDFRRRAMKVIECVKDASA